MITTSAMFWDPVLLFCHSVLGAERIMFAIDSPFAPSEPDKRKIYQDKC